MGEDQSLTENTNPTNDETFEEIGNKAGLEENHSENQEEDFEKNQSEENGIDNSEEFEFSEDEGEEETPKVVEAPIDYSLEAELQRLFSRPLYIVALALGILLIVLFILIAFDLKAKQKVLALEGYVKVHHHLPRDYKGKVSPEIEELLKIYKQEEDKIREQFLLIKEDPRENKPLIGDKYPDPVDNKKLMEILQKQKDLGKVDLGGAEKTESMNLSGLNLTKLNYVFFYRFVGSDVRFCDFTGVKAEGLEFRGASLQYSQFVDASITKSNFVRARLSFTNFYNTTLDNSIFIGASAQQAHFSNASLINTDFTNSIILDSDFEETTADGMIAKGAHFEGVSFRGSSLIGANFRKAILREVSFVNCNLTNANFEGADLSGSNFEGANLEGTNFKGANFDEVNFAKVQNASYEQLNQSLFLPSARNIPDELMPKKYNWEDRITPPRRT